MADNDYETNHNKSDEKMLCFFRLQIAVTPYWAW